jgi:hypothetical protein
MANKHKLETVCGVVCAAVLFLGLTIYHAGVTSNDVPGTYSVRYPFGEGLLRLHGDGRYEQILRINGREASVAGRWTWKSDESLDLLSLSGCLVATNGFGQLNTDWHKASGRTCRQAVTKRFHVGGPVEIMDDESYPYRQVSPLPAAMLSGPSASPAK